MGNILLSPSDEFLFAISESGVTVVNLSTLNTMPSVTVSSKSLYFSASLCDLAPITQTVQIGSSGGGSFSWTASTTVPDVELEPTSGTEPATLQITVDSVKSRFRGTAALGAVTVSSEESISGDQTVSLLLNLHSPDQVGTLFPVDGFLSDILVDEDRQRVYLVNSSENQIEVFSMSQNAFLPPVVVGSIPKSIAFDADRKELWVTHLGRESIGGVDADSLRQIAEITIPHPRGPSATLPGTLPFSIAHASGSTLLVAAAPAAGARSGTIYGVNQSSSPFEQRVTEFPDLGDTSNAVSAPTFLASSANGAFILGAQNGGTVHLYNSTTGNFVISRSLGVSIAGNAAASADGSWYHAGDQVLSSVLVPQDPIPPTIEGVRNTVTGFAFAPLGTTAYWGIRPDLLFTGLPPAL